MNNYDNNILRLMKNINNMKYMKYTYSAWEIHS